MDVEFIGLQREMKQLKRYVGAVAWSSAAQRAYNNIIFRFLESFLTADKEQSLDPTGDRFQLLMF